MHLKILLPFRIFADAQDVLRIVAQTSDGSVGLLPHRLDCAATLVPGILEYETAAEGTSYLALDAGVMIKTGPEVRISVRRAIAGTDLAQLHQQVEQEFLILSAQERETRSVIAKLEGGFLRRFVRLHHG